MPSLTQNAKQKIKNGKQFVSFVFLIFLVLVFFHKLIFTNLILARGDTFLYFYPYWSAAAEALRNGRVPLWNPQLFMGVPMLANSQIGFFYPLNWPFWLLLPTPYAVSASIALHILIAGAGAYLAGRRVMGFGHAGGLITGISFALGGYLTAQVEHINQLQGLAWLPWLLVVVSRLRNAESGLGNRNWRLKIRTAWWVGMLFALQLLAGHMQTAFITGVGLGLWLLVGKPTHMRQYATRFMPLVGGTMIALLLAAIQLLPTFELIGLSSRQGGLAVNEALSFSLNPLHLARTILPGYGQALNSEYMALLPITIFVLAFVGAWQWRRQVTARWALVWVLGGLLLALGIFNPINWLFARLPGFSSFRVPARWLILYAFGMALLAGNGFQILWQRAKQAQNNFGDDLKRPFIIALLLICLLIGYSFLAELLVDVIPPGPEAPFERPSPLTLLGWSLEIIFLTLFYRFFIHVSTTGEKLTAATIILPFISLIALFLATRLHPYNHPTTPEAYFDLRPPISRLQVASGQPPDRFLSLSNIFFDPGDQAEIDTIYADQLLEQAQYDYIITIKQKEIIAPNLPLVYGLASVDGFDGGILPLNSYSQLMKLLLPGGEETKDGRLRENLDAVPEARWLDLFNARYLITDKVGDVWRDGVFFDRQHPVNLAARNQVAVGYLPEYEATEIWLLADQQPGQISVTAAGESWKTTPEQIDADLFVAKFPVPATLKVLTLSPCHPVTPSPCQINALTLVDNRDNTFQPLVPGNYRLIHSGDVKVYENLDVLPRAFLVNAWHWQASVEGSVNVMADPDFDPRETAVLIHPNPDSTVPFGGQADPGSGQVAIIEYRPEQVVLKTESDAGRLLLLTDAYYPGWEATIDRQPVQIYQTDALFRGVFVQAGAHEVAFEFRSRGFEYGRIITIMMLLLGIAGTVIYGYRRKR